MEKTASADFTIIKQFLLQEPDHFHREDYYFAKLIAAMTDGDVEKALIKFEMDKKKAKHPLSPEEKWKRSQDIWKGFLGIKQDGTYDERRGRPGSGKKSGREPPPEGQDKDLKKRTFRS